MTTTRLLIINTAEVEKEVQKIIKKHSKYYGDKDTQIADYDVHSQSGQVLRLTYSSCDIENELSKIDETKLVCLTTDDKGGYSFFGKLKPNSFNATISAYAGIVVGKNKKAAKKLKELASDDSRVEIARFFEVAVKDIYPDCVSYQVNPYVSDVRFLDIMKGIDLISAELEKAFDGFNCRAIWYWENDGCGYECSRGEMCDVEPFIGVIAHIIYTKSDGTSWIASSESNDINDWSAPPESTAVGGRF
ncbi:MAG: hypothetical protein A3J24_07235 [Deltaproteobacteria bacterium RIFCSPLOWO2_02_FULL_53_8]|nr:MAG: hypothetical protein A3J24_07235 [Deltaproteobacteria bacterium RIFCSPLOWO2_02_FULL_53_8]